LTDEEKKKLLTIDDLYASCKGDLRDSIWAPKNSRATQANIAAANTSLLSKIENKGPVATSTSFKQNPSVKVETMSPPSVSPYPVKVAGAGLGSSRWYTQDSKSCMLSSLKGCLLTSRQRVLRLQDPVLSQHSKRRHLIPTILRERS